jgi:hypothetical protein
LAYGSVSTITTKAAALGSPCFTASWAALGLVGIPFGSIKLLLLSSKGEGNATVRTLQHFVCKPHWMTSFLIIFGLSFGHPMSVNKPERVSTKIDNLDL